MLFDRFDLSRINASFKGYEDYINEDCHYLDGTCNFYEHDFKRKFDNLIFCNPYNYGYLGLSGAKIFFDKAGDILSENGRIHIIGKSSNKWCKKDALDSFLKNEIPIYKSKYNYEVEDFEELDSNHPINVNYVFFESGLKKITIPNEKIIIKKI